MFEKGVSQVIASRASATNPRKKNSSSIDESGHYGAVCRLHRTSPGRFFFGVDRDRNGVVTADKTRGFYTVTVGHGERPHLR